MAITVLTDDFRLGPWEVAVLLLYRCRWHAELFFAVEGPDPHSNVQGIDRDAKSGRWLTQSSRGAEKLMWSLLLCCSA